MNTFTPTANTPYDLEGRAGDSADLPFEDTLSPGGFGFQMQPDIPDMAQLRAAARAILERSVAEKRDAEIAYPYPPVAPPCHPLTALLSNPDASDSALLDECYGVEVVFVNPCVAGRYPRQQMRGVIVGLETWGYGVRMLQVKSSLLNMPKWLALDRVQFIAQNQTNIED